MILVTGGAGFIGSNLVARLAEDGARVAVCDRLGSDDRWRNLAKHPLEALVDPDGMWAFLDRHGAEIEAICHMGAVSSTTETDVDLIAEQNVRLPQRIWHWCSGHDVPLVYASSAATYGDGSRGFRDDESPEAMAGLRPLNAYGWSKHVFDRWVVRHVAEGRDRPPQWAGLKFFNVYGPNELHKGDMRSVVTKAYPAAAAGKPVTLFRSHHPDYTDGGQMRDFIYVRDCVDVMVWLLEHREVNGLFNLGTGRAQTWVELMAALYAAAGSEMSVSWVDTPEEIRDRYQYFTQADMSKLRHAGYGGEFLSVEDGVRHYVETFLSSDDPHR